MSDNSHEGEFEPFIPSGLIETEADFNKLRSGQLGTTGKRIAMLHKTGGFDSYRADQLAERSATWGDEAVDEGMVGEGDDEVEVWVALTPYFVRINDRVRELDQNREVRQGGGSGASESEDLRQMMAQIFGAQAELIETIRAQYTGAEEGISEVLSGSGDNEQLSRALVEAFGKQPSFRERSRWTDVEYENEFYTRFYPNSEPRFYTDMETGQHKVWDAKWQVARAAYVKKSIASFPEKYKENKDLEQLSQEQIGLIYNTAGVKEMWEGYADAIVNNTRVTLADGRSLSIYECRSKVDFNAFREALRERELTGSISVLSAGFELASERSFELKRPLTDVEIGECYDLIAKEADAAAWNLTLIFCQFESSNSYYSHSGRVYGDLPSAINSADFRSVFAPQERYFGKMLSGQNWGMFSNWGLTQVKMIKDDARFDSDKDEIVYRPAPKGKYWTWDHLRSERPQDPDKAAKGGRVIAVYAPECYPVRTCGSYMEETKYGDKTLLNHLLDRTTVDFESASAEDACAAWLFSKFNRGVSLQSYFMSGEDGKTFDAGKPGMAIAWGVPLEETLNTRLKLEQVLNNLRSSLPPGKITYQDVHNVIVWAVYASTGGVKNPKSKEVTNNMGGVMNDEWVIEKSLKGDKVRLLKPKEKLVIN